MTGRPGAAPLPKPSRGARTFVWAFGSLMVLTAGTAFLFKLIEFVWVATRPSSDAVASFLIPVLNYLVVAAGFACLFLWAYARGEFRDVEGTARRMLEMQERIDRVEAASRRRSRHA